MAFLSQLAHFIGRTFALWVLLFSAFAYNAPDVFLPVVPYIIWLLGVVMFGMGLTLSPSDFTEVVRRPRDVAMGVAAQYTVMPLVAFGLTRLVPMAPEIAAGVILVGCCPGGTASNVMTFLAKGDVALSVTLTTVSTMLAPLLTPLLVWVFARQYLPVDAVSMFVSIVQIILLPLVLGVVVKLLLPRASIWMHAAMPMVSASVVVVIIAAVVAINQPKLAQSGFLIITVVAAHNAVGLLVGSFAARVMGLEQPQRTAVTIEVAMQNSGLGAALAQAHFSPLAAVPSAIFSVVQNVSGAAFTSLIRRKEA
ncbi:MAG: bile acid:sodium symporter family protein [Rhodospirillaceae bacterium]|nr:bile acid:sodium symporter family protein [Rhodospirillaceae bacterium]